MCTDEHSEQAKKLLISKTGVSIHKDFNGTLIKGNCPVWPPVEVLQKLYRRAREPKLRSGSLDNCKDTKLDYYCDLQSCNSEDSLTWNYFGTLSHEAKLNQIEVTNQIIRMCKERETNTEVEISLFRRLPHPDTFIQSGPEIDVLINGDKAILLIECKWNSKVGKNQGKNKDKDQLDIRLSLKRFLEKVTEKKVYVILLSREKEITPIDGVIPICWDQIIGIHPLEEVKAAYVSKVRDV